METRRGSRTPRTYINEISEDDIVDYSDPLSVADYEILQTNRRLERLNQHAISEGFASISDAVSTQLCISSADRTSQLQLSKAQVKELLLACFHHRELDLSAVSEQVCGAASKLFRNEIINLSRSTTLQNWIQGHGTKSLITPTHHGVWMELVKTAPHLTKVLQCITNRNTKADDDNGDHEHDADNDDNFQVNESDPLTIHFRSISDISEMPRPSKRVKRPRLKGLPIIMVTSILMFARSQKANTLQRQLGYFFLSTKTPKRVIETLHRLGITLSYDAMLDTMREVAVRAEAELRLLAEKMPAFFSSFDNMNYYAKVRDERQHNLSQQVNEMVAYIAYNPRSRTQNMFTSDHVKKAEINNIIFEDFIPTSDNMRTQRSDFMTGMYETLNTYCGIHLVRVHDGQPLNPFTRATLYQIPVQETKVMTLPAMDLDEAKIDEITQVMREITSELGYTREQHLQNKVIMFKGDRATVRNMRYFFHNKCVDFR